MLDTVVAAFQESPELWKLEDQWIHDFHKHPYADKKESYRFSRAIGEGASITFKFYPSNKQYSDPRLEIQVSVPKVLFGNNIEMVTTECDIQEAKDKINAYIHGCKWVPDVDFGKGILYRVDACYNHQVGDHVQNYLESISKLHYPHREPVVYREGTVYFPSKALKPDYVTYFYDKWKQSHLANAHGILRQESSIRKRDNLEKELGVFGPTLNHVRIEWLVDILRKDLERMKLAETVFYDEHRALDILTRQYGYATGLKLAGYLDSRQNTTREEMIAKGAKLRTIQSWEKQIADAGVALSTTGEGAQLPPLHIDWEGPGIAQMFPSVLGTPTQNSALISNCY